MSQKNKRAFRIGDLLDLDFPPVLGNEHIAGTHPGLIIGFEGDWVQVLACTSNVRRSDGTLIPQRITGLRCDTLVVHQVRCLGHDLLERGRYLLTLPLSYVTELRRHVRKQLRARGRK